MTLNIQKTFESLTNDNICTYEEYLVTYCNDNGNNTTPPITKYHWDVIVSILSKRKMVYSNHTEIHHTVIKNALK